VATLDQLSGGRAVLAVGLGALDEGMPTMRCDGVIPLYQLHGRAEGPDDARAARDWLAEHGAGPGFDIVIEGETPAGDPAAAAAVVGPWAEAGCTWWLETRWEMPHDTAERMTQIRERLAAGPPPATART
jgi:alkanesulfonate monooxygenase SsuD/methylene tetrahydromethanopterin reductase-like flavin-dependent oxidoreductase (luciferase family)